MHWRMFPIRPGARLNICFMSVNTRFFFICSVCIMLTSCYFTTPAVNQLQEQKAIEEDKQLGVYDGIFRVTFSSFFHVHRAERRHCALLQDSCNSRHLKRFWPESALLLSLTSCCTWSFRVHTGTK